MHIVDSDDSSDEMIAGMDPDQVYTHPYTGERFTVDELQNCPELQKEVADLPKCSDPGHNCLANFESYIKHIDHIHECVPEEKIPMKVVYREQWGSLPPKEPPEPYRSSILKVMLTYYPGVQPCYNEDDCKRAMRELQKRHMEDWGLSDIAYNFVVGGDMTIYEGRGWKAQSDDALKYPQWRHRRFDVAFFTPVNEETKCPELEVQQRFLDFLDIGKLKKDIDMKHELYEIKDSPSI